MWGMGCDNLNGLGWHVSPPHAVSGSHLPILSRFLGMHTCCSSRPSKPSLQQQVLSSLPPGLADAHPESRECKSDVIPSVWKLPSILWLNSSSLQRLPRLRLTWVDLRTCFSPSWASPTLAWPPIDMAERGPVLHAEEPLATLHRFILTWIITPNFCKTFQVSGTVQSVYVH